MKKKQMSSKTILKKRSLEITLLVIITFLFVGCLVSTIVLAVLYKKAKNQQSTMACATSEDGTINVCCHADELLKFENDHYQCKKEPSTD